MSTKRHPLPASIRGGVKHQHSRTGHPLAQGQTSGLYGESQNPIRKLELGDVEMAGHSFNRRGEVKPVSPSFLDLFITREI